MNKQEILTQLGWMVAAANFFEFDFPREAFRKLLWRLAEVETDDWARKTELQNMSAIWTDGQIHDWRARMGGEG
jgi:hypothetical protein